MIFEDEAARQFYQNTPWVQQFVSVIYPENLDDILFEEYQVIASTKEFA